MVLLAVKDEQPFLNVEGGKPSCYTFSRSKRRSERSLQRHRILYRRQLHLDHKKPVCGQ